MDRQALDNYVLVAMPRALVCAARPPTLGILYQHLADPWSATTERRLQLLPPMIDLYVVIVLH